MAAQESVLVRLSASARSLWRLRNFRRFWIANLVSNLGTSAFVMALSWLTVKSYGSAGIAALALGYGVPQFLLEVVGGAAADRINRRRLFLLTESGFLLVALALWGASLLGAVPLWMLVGLTVCNGAISAFDSRLVPLSSARWCPKLKSPAMEFSVRGRYKLVIPDGAGKKSMWVRCVGRRSST